MSRRHSLQSRLTMVYGGLFLGCGVLLLGITNLGVRSDTRAPFIVERVGIRPVAIPPVDGEGVDRLWISSGVALVIGLVVAVALGWWMAGRILRPLRTITATARDISATNLHERLALGGPQDELRELGSTLDDLFGRLEASFESQRHFVANASHELRTPLTAERALLQVALADPDATADTLRTACEEVVALGAQQERLIDALLTLAVGERGLEHRDPVDLAAVAGNVVAARTDDAEGRGLSVRTSLGPAQAMGDARLVESLVANLTDNAVRHNLPEAGWIEVATAARPGGGATLTVANSGAVIEPDDLARLFQPFQRAGDARTARRGQDGEGHGLGLAIVEAIAESHGATLTARPRAAGGLEVEVEFPA